MNVYRLSKYNPKYRDIRGIYLKDEWNSYYDDVNIEEYKLIENNYCDSISLIIKKFNIKNFKVKNLEKYSSLYEITQYNKIILTNSQKQIFKIIRNDLILNKYQLYDCLKLLLREFFWCQLESDNKKLIIETGYEFYIHLYCDFIDLEIIKYLKNKNIFIELWSR